MALAAIDTTRGKERGTVTPVTWRVEGRPMADKLEILAEKLRDERSKRILFVAHCALNENARYQGGAFRKGANGEILDQAMRAGVGIVQLPCPEQRAWGGVQRPMLWLMLEKNGTLLYLVRRPLLALAVAYTKWVFGRMARAAVRLMRDYARSGYEIVGVVGIAGSPSCGVLRTFSLVRGAEYTAAARLQDLERHSFNLGVVRAAGVPGRGYFIEALQRDMRRQGIQAPFFEHDFIAEVEGCPRPLDLHLAP